MAVRNFRKVFKDINWKWKKTIFF